MACKRCSSKFGLDEYCNLGVKTPVLLTCGHNICFGCTKALSKTRRDIACPACEATTVLQAGASAVKDVPLDKYILGQLLVLQKMRHKPTSYSVQISIPNSQLESAFSTSEVKCGDCTSLSSVVNCLNCNENFCHDCFTKTHKNSLSLRKHQVQPIQRERPLQEPEMCEVHKQVVEFFCKDDDMKVCSLCFVQSGKHHSHAVLPLVEKKKDALAEISSGNEHIKKICMHLYVAEKKLKDYLPKLKKSGQDDAKKIKETFSHAHSLLQVRENMLDSVVTRNVENREKSVKHLLREIESAYKKLKELMNDVESCQADKALAAVDTLVAELNSVKELPCILEDIPVEIPSSVEFDDSAMGYHKAFGKILTPAREKLNLCPINEGASLEGIPEDVLQAAAEEFAPSAKQRTMTASCYMEKHKPPAVDYIPAGTSTSESSVQSHGKGKNFKQRRNNFGGSSFSSESRHVVLYRPPAPPSPPRPREWKSLQQDQVVLLHLNNPSHFWVRLTSWKPYFEWLHQQIQSYKARCDEPCVAATVAKGQLYLARGGKDNHWLRVRVQDIIAASLVAKPIAGESAMNGISSAKDAALDNCEDEDSDATAEFDGALIEDAIPQQPEQPASESELSVKVYHIDFGSSEIIPIARLHKIPMQFSEPSELAVSCGLAEMEPIDGIWTPKAISFFERYCRNRVLTMKVIDKSDLKLEVELGYLIRGDVNDTVGSIRETLLFQDMAKCISDPEQFPDRTMIKKYYYKPELPAVGTVLDVNVTFADSPEKFCVQQVSGEVDHFVKLMDTIGKFYENVTDINDWMVYNPKIGMPCVAKVEGNVWQRAVIENLPGHQRLDIHFVDYGNSCTIMWNEARRIKSDYMKFPMQAFQCGLIDVKPIEDYWSEETRDAFINLVDGIMFQMVVHEIIDGKLAVSLLQRVPESEQVVNISSELVRLGQAIRSGYSEEHVLSTYQNHLGAIAIASSNKSQAREVRDRPSTSKDSACPANYMPITVTHVKDPGEIYVQVEDRRELFDRMTAKLQEWYNDVQLAIPSDHTWNKGDYCAVRSRENSTWLRCMIKRVKSPDLFEVKTLDYGYCMDAPRANMRVMDDSFLDDPAYACQCHLANINAAGGKGTWTASAVDFVKNCFQTTTNNVFMDQVGPDIAGSMSVDLYIKKIDFGGALDPTRILFLSTCKAIVEAGFAIPLKRIKLEPGSVPEVVQRPVVPKCEPLPPQNWLEPKLPSRAHWKCTAIPTHVDEDAIIYLRDKSLSDQLKSVTSGLTAKYKNTAPAPTDLYWFKDEICVAFFELDCKWHRARVVSVLPEGVEVVFIDYGNHDILQTEHLRKKVFCTDVPPLSWPCKLRGIEPKTDDAVWPKEVLDFMHKTIVNEHCTLEVLIPPTGNDLMEISLKLPTEVDVGQLLVSMDYAICHTQEDMDISNDENGYMEFPDPDTLDDIFPELMPPPVEEVFRIQPTQPGPLPNVVLVQRLLMESPQTEYGKEVNEQYSFTEKMCATLNMKAADWPNVENIKIGTACCAKFSLDNNWYRAIVQCLHGPSTCQVLFVDYGNKDIVSTTDLRLIPRKFLNFPRQHITCKLHQVVPTGEDGWTENLMQKFNQLWNNPPGDLFAHVKANKYPVEVDIIYYGRDGNSYLAYQSLIDEGLVRLVRAS